MLLGAGCDRSQETSRRLEETQDSGAAFLRDLGRYGYAQKEDFVAAMRREVDRLDREMEALAAKTEQASEAVKAEARPKIAALRQQSAQLKEKIDAAVRANEPEWENFKQDLRDGYQASSRSLDETRRWLSDKIAP